MTIQNENIKSKISYTNFLRKKLFDSLKPCFGKMIVNKKSGISARISKKSVEKMGSDKAIEKSKANGFSVAEHFEAANSVVSLFEDAQNFTSRPPKENNPNIISIKRFYSSLELSNKKRAVANITVKETKVEGNRIYSVEVLEINKASEQADALNDAAETANNGN